MTNKDQELPEGRPTDADITSSPDSPVFTDGLSGQDATSAEVAVGSDAGVENAADNADTADRDTAAGHDVTRSVAGSTWVALIIGAVILVLLLVFILQNGDSAELKVFFWTWNFPIGVGMLIAAVAGALIAASIGTVRIIQLRHQVRSGK